MRLRSYLALAVVVGCFVQPLGAQLTDNAGLITSGNWLVLGPFANPFGCGSADDMLGNHIAPSYITCEYPEEGDEIEYDPDEAVSTGYGGLDPEPVWRRFDDGSDDGDINLDGDETDPIALLTFLFGGDGEPVPPAAPGTPDTPCGPDPAGSQDLGCNSYTSCE